MKALIHQKYGWLATILVILLAASYGILYIGYGPETLVALSHGRIGTGPHTYTVQVSENGFSPSSLTVISGDTVVFHNTAHIAVWPASDPHPTHEYLDGFDPKKGLQPDASWTFVFNKTGSWQYHDHLNVTSHGEVIVLGTNMRRITETAPGGVCDGPCFDALIKKTVETKGIDAAYDLFKETYAKGELPRSCHWTAHQIGEAAYDLFKANKDFPISSATSYCGYGFYHGFMERLLRENPDPKYALAFCDKVKEKLGTMGLWNCYHGIGHGYTEDPPPQATYGDFQAMIAPGTKMCEYLFGKDFRNLNLCLTGVFTVPTGFAGYHTFGLALDPKRPFSYCVEQPYKYKKACYGEFAAKLDSVLGWNIHKLPAIVNTVSDPKLKRLITWVVPSVMMARDIQKNDQSSYINACRDSFTGNLRTICWGGTILGFFSHGQPDLQYIQIINFCKSQAWQSDDERRFCWGEGFRQMRQNYTIDKVKQLCPLAPVSFQDLCLDEAHAHTSPYDDPSFDTP